MRTVLLYAAGILAIVVCLSALVVAEVVAALTGVPPENRPWRGEDE